MKTLLKHIVIISAVISMAACSMEQLDYPVSNKDSFVEVVARPTSFSSYNVATKAAPLPTAPTEMETRIASAYIMTFGADGTLVEYKEAEVSNNQITPVRLYTNAHKGKLTVYYLVNVPESYVKSIKNISDLSSKDKALPITYATYDQAGAFGVPVVDGQQCFPMAGKVEFNGPAADGKVKVVPLQRLFAKVYVNLSMTLEDFDIVDGLNFNPPFFRVDNYSLTNLPSKVLIDAPVETPWVSETTDGFFQEAELYKLPTPIHVYDTQVTDLTLGGLLGTQRVKEYETVFYVPEYILTSADGASDNNDQSMKADFCPDGKRPLIMTLSGVIHHSGYDITMSYDVYMGSDAFSSFSLYRNTQYNNYLSIKGIDDVFLDDRVEIPGINLADPNETGTEESANCYIISQPGRYLIPTYKGNTAKNSNATTMSGVPGSETIYINGSTANDVQEITMIEKDGKNYIQFDVNLLDDEGTLNPTEVEAGNQLLVLKDESGNIIWSWHLWFCKDDDRPDMDEFINIYPNSSANVMNRALGAIVSEGYANTIPGIGAINLAYWQDGLYYQWGRKDPLLPQSPSSNGDYSTSIKNPTVLYSNWNASGAGWSSISKQMNDPCPPGYMVPEVAIWRDGANESTGMEEIMTFLGLDAYPYNIQATTNMSVNITYPYSSYINNSGQVEPEPVNTITKSYVGLEKEFPLGLKVLGYNINWAIVKDLVLEIQQVGKSGLLWAADERYSFSYGHSSLDININNIAQIADKITIKSLMIKRNHYSISWTGIKSNWDAEFSPGTGADLNYADKLFLLGELFNEPGLLSDFVYEKKQSPANYGAYVRCVRE